MMNQRRYSIFFRHLTRMFISVFMLGAIVAGCADDMELPVPVDPDVVQGERGYLVITLNSSELTTRDTEDGIDNLNENTINSVTICMSPSAGDRLDTDKPVFMQTFTGLKAKGSVTLRIPLTMEMRTRLFQENSTNKCKIFAAVNVAPGNATTVAELRNMVINSKFAVQQTQASFTMDGDSEVTYNPALDMATGKVQVQRSACKFTLALNIEKTIESDGKTWEPNLKGMSVMLQQGVQTSTLDPKPEPNMSDGTYFNTSATLNGDYTFAEDPKPVSGLKYKYDWVQQVPLYSYPNKWTSDRDETHGTYLLLTIPWSNDGGATYRTCYYHVPVVKSGVYETVRNMSYHINLHVAVLGSFVPDEPMEQLEADYYVADWGSEDLEVEIKDYRYLVVDQNEYTVNNQNSISIPFYTSHPTKVISATMTYYRYNFSDQGSEFPVTITEAQNNDSRGVKVFTADFDNGTKTLNITHDLVIYTPYTIKNNKEEVVDLTRRADGTRAKIDNDTEIKTMLNQIQYYKKPKNDDSEFSRIKFEVKVQHIDVSNGDTGYNKDKDYIETITVWQYPGMYITAVQNYCANLGQNWIANANLGNTMINGNTDGNAISFSGYLIAGNSKNTANIRLCRRIYNYQNWDRSIGLGTPEKNYLNWNPNLYLVTITQLSEALGKIYIIDDPRSQNINNSLSNNDGSYTVDGGEVEPWKAEYWYFSNWASNCQYKSFPNEQNPKPSFLYNGTWYATGYSPVLTGFGTFKAKDGDTRTLKYYYPTREADNNTRTIAPKFRICSSYGGTNGYLTREMARRRAAAYQELGYYAGRWRLPTFGEVEYIMTLSAQNKIPRLFGTTSSGAWYYWCAQGAVRVPDTTNLDDQSVSIVPLNSYAGGSTFYGLPADKPTEILPPFSGDNYLARTRFVYDEWYWGSETLTASGKPNENNTVYTFTWGDEKRK